MKNFLLLLICLFIAQTITLAQDYSLTATEETYVDLDNPISVNNGLTWHEPNFTLPIGFDFTFFDETINELNFNENASYLTGSTPPVSTVGFFINGFLDMTDRGLDVDGEEGEPGSLSPISYQLSGNVGNRIFKLEYKDVGFYYEASVNGGVFTDFASIQMWLYEADDAIEFRYGASSLIKSGQALGSTSELRALYAVAVMDETGELTEDALTITGFNSYVTLVIFDNLIHNVAANIPENAVYRIARIVSATNEINNNITKVTVVPNPTTGVLQVETNIPTDEILSVEILENTGRILKDYEDLNNIDISDLPAACYLLQIQTAEGRWNEQVVKF